jgi:hypothetical protein
MKSKLSFSERLRVFTKPLPSNEKGCWACTVVPASKRATLDKHRQTQKSHVNLIASQFAHVDAYLSYYMSSYKLIINECLRLQQHYPANRPARASLEVSIESRTINLNHKKTRESEFSRWCEHACSFPDLHRFKQLIDLWCLEMPPAMWNRFEPLCGSIDRWCAENRTRCSASLGWLKGKSTENQTISFPGRSMEGVVTRFPDVPGLSPTGFKECHWNLTCLVASPSAWQFRINPSLKKEWDTLGWAPNTLFWFDFFYHISPSSWAPTHQGKKTIKHWHRFTVITLTLVSEIPLPCCPCWQHEAVCKTLVGNIVLVLGNADTTLSAWLIMLDCGVDICQCVRRVAGFPSSCVCISEPECPLARHPWIWSWMDYGAWCIVWSWTFQS